MVRQIRLIKGSGRLGLNKVVGGYDHRTGVITIYSKAPELAKTVFHEVAHNIY